MSNKNKQFPSKNSKLSKSSDPQKRTVVSSPETSKSSRRASLDTSKVSKQTSPETSKGSRKTSSEPLKKYEGSKQTETSKGSKKPSTETSKKSEGSKQTSENQIDEQITKLDKELKDSIKETNTLQSENYDLTKQLEQSGKDLENAHTENKGLLDQISELQRSEDELLKLRSEDDHLRGELHDQISELKNYLATSHAKNENLRIQNSELKEKSDDFNKKYQQSEENLKAYRATSNDLRDEISRLKGVSEHEGDLKRLKKENKKLKENLDKISEYEEKLRDLGEENEGLSNEISGLNEKIDEITELNEKLKVSEREGNSKKLHEISEKNEKLHNEISELKERLNEASKRERNLKSLKQENERLQHLLKTQPNGTYDESNLSDQLSRKDFEIKNLCDEIEELTSLMHRQEKGKQELLERNIKLKAEASQYQSILGNKKNLQMNDDDKNHSVQLKNDITDLQKMLKDYITTLKGNYEVNHNSVKDLMKQYKIKTKDPNKPLIKAVLQYHILSQIMTYAERFFEENTKSGSLVHLESVILSQSRELEKNLIEFSNTRNEQDTVTQTASIKIRQEVNVALGNRGFSDILDQNNGSQEHIFITRYKNDLNEEMNKYRIIKDPMKKESVENLASKLIREFIRIIWFRLNIQEPSIQMKWVPIKSKIDPSIMEGAWDEEEIDGLEVEICSFPMIGRDLDDVNKRKICTHAQVLAKKKPGFFDF